MNRTSTRTQRLGPLTVAALTAASFLVGPGASIAGAQTDAYVVNTTTNAVDVITTSGAGPAFDPANKIAPTASPSQVVISGDGQWVFVADGSTTTVAKVFRSDPQGPLSKQIDVGGVPSTLAVSGNGRYLYVLRAAGDLVGFDTNASTATLLNQNGPIAIGGTFGGMALTPDGSKLYVAVGDIAAFDAMSVTKLQTAGTLTLNDPNNPSIVNFGVSIVTDPDPLKGRAYVAFDSYNYAAFNGFSATGGIAVIDTINDARIDSINLFSLPGSIALSGNHLYVGIQYIWADTLYGAGFLPSDWFAAVDVTPNVNAIAWISLGAAGPVGGGTYTASGVAVTPDGSSVLVAIPNVKGLAVIDAATGQLKPTVGLDGAPTSLAIVPDAAAPKTTFTIVAGDDAPTGTFAPGGKAVANVLSNDTLGGAPAVAGANVTAPVAVSAPDGLTLDAAGAVWVDAGAAPGSHTLKYKISEVGNPANSATGTVTVNVRGAFAITAGDDSGSSVPGGFAVTNVLANDTLNGATASLAVVTLTVTGGDSAAISIDAWGSAVVAANALAGPHSITYKICETASPANCSNAATVSVNVLNRPIVATDDAVTVSRQGGVSLLNVMANDKFNGGPALGNVAFFGPAAAGGVSVDAAGNVSVANGAPTGTQALKYQICEVGHPDNCASANLVVTVTANLIVALGDAARLSPRNPATAISNVLANDSVGGAPATTSNVTLRQVSVTPTTDRIVLTASGAVNVLSNATTGTFSLIYEICEIGSPTNCARATATINLSGGGGGGRGR